MRSPHWALASVVVLLASMLAASPCVGAEESPAADLDAGEREARLLFNTAGRLYREKSWSEAAQVFTDFLDRFPRHADAPEARFARGYCRGRLGRHAEAAADFRAALAREDAPWAAEAGFHLGRSLEALAEKLPAGSDERKAGLRAAAESYARAERLSSRSAPAPEEAPGEKRAQGPDGKKAPALDLKSLALASQGEALYKAGLHAEAVRALEPIAAAPSGAPGAGFSTRGLYTLALAHLALGPKPAAAGGAVDAHRAEARKLLARVAPAERAEDPLWEEAAFLLARILHDDGDRAAALERYAAVAARGGPRAAEAACHRAIALYEGRSARDLAQALAELGRFVDGNAGHPLAPRARFYEALCLFDLKRYGEAAGKLAGLTGAGQEHSALASLRLGQALLLKEPAEPRPALAALDRAIQAIGASSGGAQAELAQAVYWQGEARLALGGDSLAGAAKAFGEVAERHREVDPPLAEKALYQEARALYLAGDRKGSAARSKEYRRRYPREKGRYYLDSLKLSAENGRRADAGELDEDERRAAPGYYAEAASLSKEPVESRRLRYLSGIASYERGSWAEAAASLEQTLTEARARRLPGFDEPELPFFLADSLLRIESPAGAPPGRERILKAAGLLEEFLAQGGGGGPRAAAALLDLGLARERLEDLKAAQKSFERLLADHAGHPLAPEARLRLANAELALGDLEAAAGDYLRAAEAATDPAASGRARLQAAILERRLGKPEKAMAILDALKGELATRLSSSDAGRALLADARAQRSLALSDLARRALDGGDPSKALATLAPLLEPGAAAGRDQALYLRAWCFDALAEKATGKEKDRCLAEVESSYRKLLEEEPGSALAPDAMVELAQRLFNRKAYPEAGKWFTAARGVLEKKLAALSPSADGRPGAAQPAAELLARALFGLGFLAFEARDFAAARDLFDRAAAGGGELGPRALFQSARACMQERADREAVERLTRLLEDPSPRAAEIREEALLRLGECRQRLGDYPGAAAALREMLDRFPGGPLRHEGRFALGFSLQSQKDFDGAVKAFRHVVAETDAVAAARAQYHLGECFMDRGRHREAAREFLTVAANFDFEGPYRDWLRRALLAAGLAYQAAGEPATARKQFEELTRRFPESEEGRAAAERLRESKESPGPGGAAPGGEKSGD